MGSGFESLLFKTLVKELEPKGSLHVSRCCFNFFGKTFQLVSLVNRFFRRDAVEIR
jgi:hypothetical protein